MTLKDIANTVKGAFSSVGGFFQKYPTPYSFVSAQTKPILEDPKTYVSNMIAAYKSGYQGVSQRTRPYQQYIKPVVSTIPGMQLLSPKTYSDAKYLFTREPGALGFLDPGSYYGQHTKLARDIKNPNLTDKQRQDMYFENQLNLVMGTTGGIKNTSKLNLIENAPKMDRLKNLIKYPQELRRMGYTSEQINKINAREAYSIIKNNVAPFMHPTWNNQLTLEEAKTAGAKAQYMATDEMRGVFDDIYAKWIGKRESAKLTAYSYAEKFKNIKSDIGEKVIKNIERPNANAEPQVKQFTKAFKNEFDYLYEYAKNAGLDFGYLKNYITHIWNKEPDEVIKLYQSAKARFPYSGERIYPTYEEGIRMGLKPKYTTPQQILAQYQTKLEQVKANIDFVNELRKEGIIVPSGVGAKTPGFSPLTGLGFPSNEVELGGMKKYIGQWYAPDEIAQVINRVFSQPDTGKLGKTFDIGRKVSGILQDVTLSGGIPKTPINAFTLANMQKEILAGRITSPVSSLVKSTSGTASQNYFRENLPTIKKMLERNIPIQTELNIENLADEGFIKNSFGNSISSIWSKSVNEPTFKRFMPMLQVNMFKDIERQALAKGMNEQQAADIAANTVKNFYGVITSDKLAKSYKLTEDVKGTILFAPKFRESMINFWVNNVKALRHPLAPENRYNVRFIVGAILTYIGYDKLNYHFNNKHLTENPPGMEDKLLIPVGGGDVIGIPYLSSIATVPRGIYRIGNRLAEGDISGAVTDAGQTFLSTGVKPLADIAANRDYFGQPIVDESSDKSKFSQIGSYLGSQYLSHPYLKELTDPRYQDDPLYQRASRATELPLRFYTEKSLLGREYYAAKDEYYKKLTSEQKAAFDAIPEYSEDDPRSTALKYQIYAGYPEVFLAKKNIAIKTARDQGKPVDPLYTADNAVASKYIIYQTLPPGSQDRKDLKNAYPEIIELMVKRTEYFAQNPIEGGQQLSAPQASPRAQSLMDQGIWNDPEVKEYLDAYRVYTNQRRELLGLLPLPDYAYSSYNKKTKKLTIKIAKPKLAKTKGSTKIKSLKLPKAPKIAGLKVSRYSSKNPFAHITKLPKTEKLKGLPGGKRLV